MGIKRFTAVDLFAGCGGLTEGLQQGGFRVVGAIEVNALAATTYRANHPDVQLWEEDIRKITAREVLRRLGLRRGQLDLLAGCPPCQGFSTMRTKNGHLMVEDPRNDLIREFSRLLKGLLPKAVMMENVPGLMTDERFFTFRNHLLSLGYKHVHYGVHNARDYGVPQRRRRLILMAVRGCPIELPSKASCTSTVRTAFDGLSKAGSSGDPVHDMPEHRSAKVRMLIAMIRKDGGSRKELPLASQLECHRRCDGFKDVYGRMAWDDVAPTITSGCFNPSKGRFLHPEEDRCMTMREAALLQSFPQNYLFPDLSSKQAVALMIGNALPPEMIRRFAGSVRQCLARALKTAKKAVQR
jgi:DNA (cytosine-5)-methyltransferase 1